MTAAWDCFPTMRAYSAPHPSFACVPCICLSFLISHCPSQIYKPSHSGHCIRVVSLWWYAVGEGTWTNWYKTAHFIGYNWSYIGSSACCNPQKCCMDTMQNYNQQKRDEEHLKRMPSFKFWVPWPYWFTVLVCWIIVLQVLHRLSHYFFQIFPRVSTVRSSIYSQANKGLLWLTYLFLMTQFKNRTKTWP